mmetsp:Transcript_10433/g.25614  ORF Transcript_10433/g.25614 Transcript_10433/m.25614 type:complete len:332 (-) Transcript_10433:11-1006(-)
MSGLSDAICAHTPWIHSSSILSSTAQSSSLVISTLVWFSPFLYSSGQSRSITRGFSMRRFMRPGATTSLFIITPLSTRQSSMDPPAIFSTLAYFLMSTSLVPSPLSTATHITASSASSAISGPKRDVYLVPMHDVTIFISCERSLMSMGNARESMIFTAASSALMYARTITVGWMSFSRNGCDRCRISPARMMTEVVPSPTSSSCVRLSSIMDLAAGWVTSISRRIALPSLVSTIPPDASRIIFSMERGPSVVRMMSDTALAAAMLFNCAVRPVSRLVLVFITMMGDCMPCILGEGGREGDFGRGGGVPVGREGRRVFRQGDLEWMPRFLF